MSIETEGQVDVAEPVKEEPVVDSIPAPDKERRREAAGCNLLSAIRRRRANRKKKSGSRTSHGLVSSDSSKNFETTEPEHSNSQGAISNPFFQNSPKEVEKDDDRMIETTPTPAFQRTLSKLLTSTGAILEPTETTKSPKAEEVAPEKVAATQSLPIVAKSSDDDVQQPVKESNGSFEEKTRVDSNATEIALEEVPSSQENPTPIPVELPQEQSPLMTLPETASTTTKSTLNSDHQSKVTTPKPSSDPKPAAPAYASRFSIFGLTVPKPAQPAKQVATKASVPAGSTAKTTATPSIPPVSSSSTYVRRRALQIGINYVGTPNELVGCIHDVRNVARYLSSKRGYASSDTVTLTDDPNSNEIRPTLANIRRAISEFVDYARRSAADQKVELFFQYSGHGTSVTDRNGDEKDGVDEALVPSDFRTAGLLLDDELARTLLQPLGSLPNATNITLLILVDACRSGTCVDLPFRWTGGNLFSVESSDSGSALRAACISGCRDDQYSSDLGNRGGAMTGAFLAQLANNGGGNPPNWAQLLGGMRSALSFYGQEPQLTCTFRMDTNQPYGSIVQLPGGTNRATVNPAAKRASLLVLPIKRSQTKPDISIPTVETVSPAINAPSVPASEILSPAINASNAAVSEIVLPAPEEVSPAIDASSVPAPEEVSSAINDSSVPASEVVSPATDASSVPAPEEVSPATDASSVPAPEEVSPAIDASSVPAPEEVSPAIVASAVPAPEEVSPAIVASAVPVPEEVSPVINDSSVPASEVVPPAIDATEVTASEIVSPVIDEEEVFEPVDQTNVNLPATEEDALESLVVEPEVLPGVSIASSEDVSSGEEDEEEDEQESSLGSVGGCSHCGGKRPNVYVTVGAGFPGLLGSSEILSALGKTQVTRRAKKIVVRQTFYF